MPGRGPQTFKKRQKEQQRKEKQQEKMARRLARKEEGPATESDEDEQEYLAGLGLTPLDRGPETPEAPEAPKVSLDDRPSH